MILRPPEWMKGFFRWETVALCVPFLIPLKLSWTYVVLIPTLIAWAYTRRTVLISRIKDDSITALLYLWLSCVLLSSFFGLQPFHSLAALPSLLFFALLIPMFAELSTKAAPEKILIAAVSGQAVAAFHTVLEGATDERIPRLFIGAVSESGQIALTLVSGISLAFFFQQAPSGQRWRLPPLLTFLLFSLVGFASYFKIPALLLLVLAIVGAVMTAKGAGQALKSAFSAEPAAARNSLVTRLLPLIFAALFVNLKRGPWLGVITGSCVFLLLYRRRLVLPLLVLSAILIMGLQPLRLRLEQSARDFSISGGRSVMWQIGAELASRFPLGIGFENSPRLRDFSPEIPRQHDHFHNNFINILVETGWIGLAVFLFWLWRILKLAFSRPYDGEKSILAAGIGCAVISTLTAGLVEYNFGDTEVHLLLFVMLGVLAGIRNQPELTDKRS